MIRIDDITEARQLDEAKLRSIAGGRDYKLVSYQSPYSSTQNVEKVTLGTSFILKYDTDGDIYSRWVQH